MNRILLIIAVITAMISCTKVQQTAISGDQKSVLALATDFISGAELTKTVITQEGKSAPTFAWKAGDVIGVIPMDGKTVQSNYEISSIGTDLRTATFDGGVWALKAGKGYAAYYPYKKEAVQSGESLEFSFMGQTQSENNSLAHIGAYDYMYAAPVLASSSATSFSFKHLVSLVRFQIVVPKTDQYTDLVIESTADWFAGKAALSLTDGTMTSSQSLKSCSVELNNIAVSSGEVLTVWLSMLPTSVLDGGSITVKLTGKDSFGTATISNMDTFDAGKAYSFSCTAKSDTRYVDLGLSVKWAVCNVGASKPEEYGDYYAWGETETKSDYHWDTYKWCDGSETTMTKYCVNSKYGTVDNKTVLEPEDDVAHVKWGGHWRMPTDTEWTELTENCTCTWTTLGGVNGILVKSNKEGYTDKSIFLPAAGNPGAADMTYGKYWSSSLDDSGAHDYRAWRRFFNSDKVNRNSINRELGFSVRPVSE